MHVEYRAIRDSMTKSWPSNVTSMLRQGYVQSFVSEDGFGNNEVGGGSNPSNVAIRSREILAAANHGLEFGRMRSYLRRGGQVGDAVA